MAERSVAFGAATARRIIAQVRAAEGTPRDQTGRLLAGTVFDDRRFFELTAELSGGAGQTAAVKWLWWNAEQGGLADSGQTGEVIDLLGAAWGLAGERGEARWLGGLWVVSFNPGQPVYEGTANGDISATASTASIHVTIGGQTRTVTANVPDDAVGTGKKYTSGDRLFIAHSRGAWRIVSFVECEASA